MKIPDRYEEAKQHFSGGMATVFVYEDTVLWRQVAIKVMPGSAKTRRILDELRALLKMRSKHVVQVYDVLSDTNDLAIIQEFIDGKDLFEEAIAPKSKHEFLKMIWQIASGISDIHAEGVIHRDIKPNNIKLDSEGVVKIFDFGLARNEGINAATIGFVGTPGFAAPELYQHNSKFSASVDTYAFGITALFLAFRDLPPELKEEPPKSCSNYFVKTSYDLADEISEILHSCLALIPLDRPKMADVKDVLAKHLLHNRHRALVIDNATAYLLDADNRRHRIAQPNKGEIEIEYDGFCFRVREIRGDVFINNQTVSIGYELPGACVIAIGSIEKKFDRVYVTFDLSHPEIVL